MLFQANCLTTGYSPKHLLEFHNEFFLRSIIRYSLVQKTYAKEIGKNTLVIRELTGSPTYFEWKETVFLIVQRFAFQKAYLMFHCRLLVVVNRKKIDFSVFA